MTLGGSGNLGSGDVFLLGLAGPEDRAEADIGGDLGIRIAGAVRSVITRDG